MVGQLRISASIWHQAIEIWSILQAVRISLTPPETYYGMILDCDVSNQRSLHNVEVTLSIHIYLGAPSLAITCASTLQIRYTGHNSARWPQDEELDKIQNTSRTNAKFQLDKYKIPTTGSLIDWARPLHTSLQELRGEDPARIISWSGGGRWNSRNPLTTEIWKSDDMPTIVAMLSTNFLTGKTLSVFDIVWIMKLSGGINLPQKCNQRNLKYLYNPHYVIVHF